MGPVALPPPDEPDGEVEPPCGLLSHAASSPSGIAASAAAPPRPRSADRRLSRGSPPGVWEEEEGERESDMVHLHVQWPNRFEQYRPSPDDGQVTIGLSEGHWRPRA